MRIGDAGWKTRNSLYDVTHRTLQGSNQHDETMLHRTLFITLPQFRWLVNLWAVFLCASGLVQLPGCRGSNGGKVPLIVYSTHGKELLSEFEAGFERDHPKMDVRWLDMGSQDVLDRVRSEKENPQADVWWGAPSMLFQQAEKESLLQAYRPTWVSEVAAEARSAGERRQ